MKFKNKLLILSLLGVFVFISTILISLLFYFNVFDNTSTNDLVVSLYQYTSIEEAFKDNNWFGMYLTIGIGSAILLLIILIIIFACAYKSKRKKIEKNKTSTTTLEKNSALENSSLNTNLPSNDESNFFANYSQQNNPAPVQRSVATKTTTTSTTRPIPHSERTTTTTTKKTVKKSTSTTSSNRK